MMHITQREKIVVVVAVVAAALIFTIGRWYWYQADVMNAIEAGYVSENGAGELEVTVGE